MVDYAMPGMLPVLNKECLHKAVMASRMFEGKLSDKMQFDRKHMFYSDMPQGY
jgi:aspartyl-tRNA(Asn)/glutamyl-tRNA(Gln) amidotransferase subunit B